MLAGGLFNIHLRGTGLVALVSDGEPVRLDISEAPTFADPQAAIAWSGGQPRDLENRLALVDQKRDEGMPQVVGARCGQSGREPGCRPSLAR